MEFRQQLGMAAHFAADEDPIPWLQIFAQRIRDGRLSARGQPVRSGTVADALLFVAQAHTMLGAPDPRRLVQGGQIDPRLSRQLRGYTKQDPPPARVKPIPVQILRLACQLAEAVNSDESLAAADMTWLAFFFLLRPGEYTSPAEDSHPFRLEDIRLWRNEQCLSYCTATEADMSSATFVALVFTTQKNGVKGETIGHGRSDDPVACPVRTVVRRLLYLRSLGVPSDTFLCAYQHNSQIRLLSSKTITSFLRQATALLGPSLGFSPSDISAKSLRAAGAMALLQEGVDKNVIQLIGRWKSDAMYRYLHIQSPNLMTGFATLMLTGGNYSLLPPSNQATDHA